MSSVALLRGLRRENTRILAFFPGFSIIAGIYGSLSADKITPWLQALPAP